MKAIKIQPRYDRIYLNLDQVILCLKKIGRILEILFLVFIYSLQFFTLFMVLLFSLYELGLMNLDAGLLQLANICFVGSILTGALLAWDEKFRPI